MAMRICSTPSGNTGRRQRHRQCGLTSSPDRPGGSGRRCAWEQHGRNRP